MKIAICDDEPMILDGLHKQIMRTPFISSVSEFTDFETFQTTISNGENFDVVLMDIEWGKQRNGIDYAVELYEKAPNIQVIFVTGYNDYSQSVFLQPINLCGFLVKPVNQQYLEILLKKAAKNISMRNKEKLIVRQKGVVYVIPFQEIYFLESRGHQMTVHSLKADVQCYEQLEKVKPDLPECFIQCHKSYIVNMNYIQRIEKNRIYLQPGFDVPISKAKYGSTKTAYFKYMGHTI